MFDDLIGDLRRLERGVSISVSLPSDADGYDEKECPSAECRARFKIHGDDWSHLASDEVVYCPLCRSEADSEQWFTPEQVEYAQRVAMEEMDRRIGGALEQGVRSANRRAPRDGLLSFSFEYKPGRRTYVAPLGASGVLEQRSTCESCGCRYASVGAAFFCPACGHNSAPSTLGSTISTIRGSLDLIPRLGEMVDRDAAADLARGIAENGMVKIVTAFQRYAEAMYERLPEPKEQAAVNAFQRLADGSRLWSVATHRTYEDVLGAADLAELGRYFQQRHLLVHDDGVVDQIYLDRSGDKTYRLGQRLVIRPDAVRRASSLVQRLAAGLADGGDQTG